MDPEWLISTAAGLVWTAASSRLPAATPKHKPNIVFIMADDLGWQELGCYGQKKIKTPHVDKMAAEGMRFMQHYAGSALCAPSRCNLMTGKHGGHAYVRSNREIRNPERGVYGGQLALPPEEVVIAELLKAEGYATGCFGKWGLGGVGTTGDPLNKGFDTFYGYNCQRHAHNLYPRYLVNNKTNQKLEGNDRKLTGKQYGPQRIADEMLDFVRTHKDEPFFVYYPTVIPHLPLQVPEKDLADYKGEWEEKPYSGTSYLPHPNPRSCYAAMITFLDKQVGRLFTLLKELGLDENTIVFFTSDNGTTFLKAQVDYQFFESVGPLKGLKSSLDEGGIRAPLVARWPGRIKPNTTTQHVSAHWDILATLADIGGARIPSDTDGISILPTLTGTGQQKQHEFLFWDFASSGGQLCVRKGKWKGIKKRFAKNPDATVELYDLEKDITQKNNVAREHPEIVAKIEAIMVNERTRPANKCFQFGTYRD